MYKEVALYLAMWQKGGEINEINTLLKRNSYPSLFGDKQKFPVLTAKVSQETKQTLKLDVN